MTCAWRQAGAVVRYLSFLAHPALLGVLDCALKNKNKNQSCLKMHFKQKQELVYLKVLQGLRYNYIFRTVCTDPFSLLRFWLSFVLRFVWLWVFLVSFVCLLASDTNLQPIWGQVINFACQLLGHCLHANLLYCLTMQCLYKGCVWIQQILLSTITST